MALAMTIEEVESYLSEVFPQVDGMFGIDRLDEDLLVMRLHVSDAHLRPGGTVSGPSMFSLADVAAYVATLARIGRQALTVTTHCSIDFMRKPEAGKDLLAEARLLKLGRTLSVTDVLLFSEGSDKPVAHASLTYSIPPAPVG
ncbi:MULTISPECIES: PaaI family thioesterase [Salipiger]|uniref:Thioesterase family protein n=1 Tax=Salipiger bermudensis (strain DSM 26914 / JCM 13377 / KCTC 12554 / HTCC2601) TaxID=314265 RepID=Q0FJN4_SALBH|nr:PaaI family thioesterase [Salipiger bermudensis]EAU44403.1 thioesterase family protein [Salipiger bermudensis HTCC2601]MAE89607.1 thioesterase [Pelagibaca sp.]MBR9891557.1 PaaI family thioesterase [bacterium]